jgi:hypothetical protein
MKQHWKGVIRTGIHTCVLCKFWILSAPTWNSFWRTIITKIWRQLSYVDNFSFQLYKSCGLNVFFKYCKSRRICYNARQFCGSVLDSYAWGHGIESWTPQNIFFFHSAAMLLLYIVQMITIPKFCIFRKSITIHHCVALLQVALMSIPPHKFVCPPCWYYRL